ncbi:MAG: hypothetical protein MZV49_05685 [Rhodopseudomonas palustris]|nr:hypothetical protein [Rhodopseudomonas palustris]
MPRESELPGGLKQLARINALKLRDDDWDSDVERLMQALDPRGPWPWRRHPVVLAVALAAALAVGAAGHWWSKRAGEEPVLPAPEQKAEPGTPAATGGAYLADIREKLRAEQEQGLDLLFSKSAADRARAIGLIDANLGRIDTALQSFPDDVYLHTLAGDAAKNVYASSGRRRSACAGPAEEIPGPGTDAFRSCAQGRSQGPGRHEREGKRSLLRAQVRRGHPAPRAGHQTRRRFVSGGRARPEPRQAGEERGRPVPRVASLADGFGRRLPGAPEHSWYRVVRSCERDSNGRGPGYNSSDASGR